MANDLIIDYVTFIFMLVALSVILPLTVSFAVYTYRAFYDGTGLLFSCILAYLILNVISTSVGSVLGYTRVLISQGEGSDILCCALVQTNVFISCFIRFAMFSAFIVRAYTVFKDSAFEYSKRSAITAVIVLATAMALLLVVFALDITCEGDCDGTIGFFAIAYFGFCDLFFQLFALWAFTSPLKKLVSVTASKDNASSKLFPLMVKAAVLTYVAVFSSLFMVVVLALTGVPILGPVDIVINSLCFAFMTRYYDRVYQYACFPFIKCISCCLKIPGANEMAIITANKSNEKDATI